MSSFTPNEVSTICLFFGVAPSEDVFELSENYVLETSSIDHPIGDSLQVHENGFIVHFVDDVAEVAKHSWYFQRDFAGLVAALERLTAEVA